MLSSSETFRELTTVFSTPGAGIVVPANVLMQHQGMVADAGTQGLLVLTYGLDNDDMDSIIRQQELGVHAAIVDDVAHVMQALCQSC